MKKSKNVQGTLIIAFAFTLYAVEECSAGRDECREADGWVISDKYCPGGAEYGVHSITYPGAHWVHVGGFGGGGSGGGFGG